MAGTHKKRKAWIVAVDMGLGHQRAVFPLKGSAKKGQIITMQDPRYLAPREAGIWKKTRSLYESVSRAGRIPVLGRLVLALMDLVQFIPAFYPRRDRSAPTRAVLFLDKKIIAKGMGKRLVEVMQAAPAPLVTSFYAVAIAAEKQGYRGDIHCIICDSDFNRAWLPRYPQGSRIRYCSPCDHVTARLQQYGVPARMIETTGFPLPKGNIGGRKKMEVLRHDVRERLWRLDPEGVFRGLHGKTVRKQLGAALRKRPCEKPLTVTFAVGGAGAQVGIALAALSSLAHKIRKGKAVLNLVAGVRPGVADRFRRAVAAAGLEAELGRGVTITCGGTQEAYFTAFNALLRRTDVLWTKPSELTFYAALGIPLVSAPPLGYHERLNYRWLEQKGAVIPQEDPRCADQWLFDYRRQGLLADRAWNGFLKMRKLGTWRIEAVLRGERPGREAGRFHR